MMADGGARRGGTAPVADGQILKLDVPDGDDLDFLGGKFECFQNSCRIRIVNGAVGKQPDVILVR